MDDQSPVYISSHDIRLAALGNEEAVRIAHGTLQSILDRADSKQGVAGLKGVRFGFKKPDAQYRTYSNFSFAGGWASLIRTNTLVDIRDLSSIDKDPIMDWKKVTWDFFPRLTHTRLKSDTVNGRVTIFQFHVYYLTVLSVLSVCMLVAWGIRWAGRKSGLRIAQKRYMWTTTVAALMGLSVVGAILNKGTGSERSTTTSQSTPVSPVYSIAALRECVLDAEKLNEWCNSVLEIISPDEEQELLLGQLWVFDSSTSKSNYQYTADSVELWISNAFSLARWGETRYGALVAPADIQESVEGFPSRSLRESGTISMLWGTSRQPQYAFIHIVNMALIVVSAYWVWAGLQWIGRLILSRIQKGRVRRGQCIFCRYPLTDEGRIARSALEST